MRKHWCAFSSAARTIARWCGTIAIFPLLLGAVETGPSPVRLPALRVSEPLTRAPNQPIRVGDRLVLQVETPPDLVAPGQPVLLRPEVPGPSPEDQGWYIDPHPSNQIGVLRFIASPLRGGSLTLPSLVIAIEGSDAPLARTEPLPLQVQELPVNPEEKPDLLDVLPVRLPTRYKILAGLAAILLAAGAVAGYRWWRRKRRPAAPSLPPPLPEEPDHVLARRRIEGLFHEHDFRPESLKRVSFGISETLKEYLSKRFDVDAREATTKELLDLLRDEGMDAVDVAEIRELFTVLDQFKFLNTRSFPDAPPERQMLLKTGALRILDRWTPVRTPREIAP